MEVSSEKIPVIKGDKFYLCTLQVVTVKGGKQMLYVAEDGTIVKKEPLFRYKERMKRRKGSKGYAVKV